MNYAQFLLYPLDPVQAIHTQSNIPPFVAIKRTIGVGV